MCPVERMTIITARPAETAQPSRVSEPGVFWFTMGVAVEARISMRVPMNSAPICRFWHQHTNNNTQLKYGLVCLSLTYENKRDMNLQSSFDFELILT